MLDNKIIDDAVEKRYSDFTDAVKAELKSKLSNHPESKKYSSEYDRIQSMKELFAKINTSGE